MRILAINSVTNGSTGNIMLEIAKLFREMGYIYYTSSSKRRSQKIINDNNHIYIGSIFSRKIHSILAKYTDLHGCFSIFSTLFFLKKINKIHPDIIHLHNLHGDYINIPLLFKYIKKKNIKVMWTLHDCWAFTGHCPHFSSINCNKWKNKCYKCPLYKEYPESYIDNSKFMWKLKKKCFLNVNMIIITPSIWLSKLVKQSFLSNYQIKVINNGIDLSIFKPTESSIRKKLNIDDNKIIILGVAFGWNNKKGLDIFIELSKKLDNKYQIVLVGTNSEVDKLLPKNIKSVHRTSNVEELVQIYSIASIFLNPTREDNFPTVNIEALACGTPVLTFNTGGSPECINYKCGKIISQNIEDIKKEIEYYTLTAPFLSDDCVKRAKKLKKNDKYLEYLNLCKEIEKK